MSTRIFVIGASHSGLRDLCSLVERLPVDFPAPILIAQHVSPDSRSRLAEMLSAAGPLPACHPRSGESIRNGHIYVAPPDHHMLVRPKYVWLSRGPRENHQRPALDVLFRSAALAYGAGVVSVVLTGYLDDGTAGAMAVKAGGGSVIVQDPVEASASQMPTSALRHISRVDHCCGIVGIAALMETYANEVVPKAPPFEARALLEAEDRLAEGVFTPADWQLLVRAGKFSGLSCPECHSALWELPAEGMLRFRCHSGHAYSAQSLASAQAEVRQTSQASLYSALLDELALSERILAEPSYRLETEFANDVQRRVSQLMLEAHQIRKWSNAILAGSGIEAPITPPSVIGAGTN